jgi:hypothetical protein
MDKTSEKITTYIRLKGQASGKELAEYLGITDRGVRKQLKNLLDAKRLQKIGKPPRVLYILCERQVGPRKIAINTRISGLSKQVVQDNFLYITPRGERLDGWSGFERWCQDRDFDIEKKLAEYIGIHKKYAVLRKKGYISGMQKMQDTFAQDVCINNVWYADFYATEVFGKTKLGQLLLYGKQSQERKIILEVVRFVEPVVTELLVSKKIDAVGFVPPTVKRTVQFMKVLEKSLQLTLPLVKIEKIKTEVITPQKTLNKLRDRIDNAEHSIFVTDTRSFKKVLLIDDAVGSGATLNQTACKLKKAKVAEKVYGFAVTGSSKGFDIISEV